MVVVIVVIVSGSLTMQAELLRFLLLYASEVLAFIALWLINRERLTNFDFGYGKIEQLANFGIGVGLAVGGVMVLFGALGSLTGSAAFIAPFDLALAAAMAGANTLLGGLAYITMHVAAAVSPSAILLEQLRVRRTRTVCSLVVLFTLTAAALARDNVVAHWLDGLGAVFVSGMILVLSVDVFRRVLPDLLDRGLDQAERDRIAERLKARFGEAARVKAIRTRRAAGRSFVLLELACPKDLTLAEVDDRRAALQHDILQDLGNCEVSVEVQGL